MEEEELDDGKLVFRVKAQGDGDGDGVYELTVEQDDENDTTNGTVLWNSCRVMAAFMAQQSLRGARVIELGAGCGLLSLLAARMGASYVMATDGAADCVTLMRRNVDRNGFSGTPRADGDCTAVVVQPLVWSSQAGRAAVAEAGAPFDVVVGTDVVYSNQRAELIALVDCLAALTTCDSVVWLGVEVRDELVVTQFRHVLSERFTHELVPEEDLPLTEVDVSIWKCRKKPVQGDE